MRYTLTFIESQYAELIDHFFGAAPAKERAAYLLCGISKTDAEQRMLVRRVIPVPDSDLLQQSGRHLSIPSRSFLSAMKQAELTKASFVFVHSHPGGIPDHSEQDDREEPGLFRTAYNRISEQDGFDVLSSYCSWGKRGPLGKREIVLTDDRGEEHLFSFEPFHNGHELLTLIAYLKPNKVIVPVSGA